MLTPCEKGKIRLGLNETREKNKRQVREKKSKGKEKGGKTKVGQRDVKVESLGNKKYIAKMTRMKEGECYIRDTKHNTHSFQTSLIQY